MASAFPSGLRPRAPFLLFSLAYLVWCSSVYKDFGVTWDEYDCYSIGSALHQYLLGHGGGENFLRKVGPWTSGNVNFWIPYDYWYTAALFALNRSFSMDLFHWLNLFVALALYGAAYEALRMATARPWGSLLGPVFLFLTPRLMGYLPNNPRDGTFAVFFFLSLAAIYYIGLPDEKGSAPPSWGAAVGVGLLLGMTQGVRMAGLMLYPIWILYAAAVYILRDRQAKFDWKPWVLRALFAFAVAQGFLFATWPYLRGDFPWQYVEILKVTAHFNWGGKVLFLGQWIPSDKLPATFLPVWLGVTTPWFILLPFLASGWTIPKALKDRTFLFLAVPVLFILMVTMILRPVVYPDYRHLLFITPPLAVLGAYSILRLWDRLKEHWSQWVLAVGVAASLVVCAQELARLHPYEYIYFNSSVGGLRGANGRFPTEHFGSGLREAVLWIRERAEKEPDRTVKVFALAQPFQSLYYFSKNMKWAPYEEADLFIAFADATGFYDEKNDFHPVDGLPVIHTVDRESVPLYRIYRLSRSGQGT